MIIVRASSPARMGQLMVCNSYNQFCLMLIYENRCEYSNYGSWSLRYLNRITHGHCILSDNLCSIGSYSGAGYLLSTLADTDSSNVTNFGRFLDLDNGVAKAQWTEGDSSLSR